MDDLEAEFDAAAQYQKVLRDKRRASAEYWLRIRRTMFAIGGLAAVVYAYVAGGWSIAVQAAAIVLFLAWVFGFPDSFERIVLKPVGAVLGGVAGGVAGLLGLALMLAVMAGVIIGVGYLLGLGMSLAR